MQMYHCDGCGAQLPKHALRYSVRIDVKAAYDELEIGLVDLVRSHRAEILALIERLKHKSPQEIEETVYKGFSLDLCPACQKAFIRNPLRFHPEQAALEVDGAVDIDAFLRSLGFGEKASGASSDEA